MSDKVKRWWPILDRWCVELGVSQSLVLAVIHMESGGNENARRYEPEYLTKEHTALSIAQLSRFAYFDHGKLPDGLPMTLAVVIGISKHPTLLPIRRYLDIKIVRVGCSVFYRLRFEVPYFTMR